MDPYIHTLVATGLLMASFYFGRYFGERSGKQEVCNVMLAAMGAVELIVEEDGTMLITYEDGEKEKIE